ncbi:hypothetical protein HMPREF1317_1729 [Schaalia georgiae F0490]|uniref:Uncharacterized protein n=1 Tax=Schaalia georgiae F0490 TaxID=1125717 RepID=J0XCK3_9ACTO|nr:hypothetical protein HMPREF1317_1729 [Schaalia georgiae F0490]
MMRSIQHRCVVGAGYRRFHPRTESWRWWPVTGGRAPKSCAERAVHSGGARALRTGPKCVWASLRSAGADVCWSKMRLG